MNRIALGVFGASMFAASASQATMYVSAASGHALDPADNACFHRSYGEVYNTCQSTTKVWVIDVPLDNGTNEAVSAQVYGKNGVANQVVCSFNFLKQDGTLFWGTSPSTSLNTTASWKSLGSQLTPPAFFSAQVVCSIGPSSNANWISAVQVNGT